MADRAYLVDDDGNCRLVMGKDMKESDRQRCFLCAGRSQFGKEIGKECRAQLFLKRSNNQNYFFSVSSSGRHIKGCEFSESKKEKLILYLDQVSRNKTDEEILSSLMNSKESPGKTGGGKTGGGPKEGDPNKKGDEDDEDLTIKRGSRPLKDVCELYTILTEKTLDEQFANKQVSKWIIDDRTFSTYRNNKLEENQIALVVLSKMQAKNMPEEVKRYSSQYYIFPTESGLLAEKIYFLIPKNKDVSDIVFGNTGKVFVVVAKWQSIACSIPTYVCKCALNKGVIGFLSS